MNEELMEMLEDKAITFPEFDDCVAGVVIRANGESVVCYDYHKVIAQLSLEIGRARGEAVDEIVISRALIIGP